MQHVHTVIVMAASVQHAHHVRSTVIVRLALHAASVTDLSDQREALAIVSDHHAASAIVPHDHQDHARVASLAALDRTVHRAMAIVHNVVHSTKKVRQEQD